MEEREREREGGSEGVRERWRDRQTEICVLETKYCKPQDHLVGEDYTCTCT